MDQLRLAIDGNEANLLNRVGSNVYAREIIGQLEKITRQRSDITTTVLLSQPPVADLPSARLGWKYQVIKPKFLWTQWAAPLYLFTHRRQFDLYFTPGHYAPRFCPLPYVSSVMDLGFLVYPSQFKARDLLQLKNWTKYSVQHAQKIVTISHFTQQEIGKYYHRSPADILVAYPSASLPTWPAKKNWYQFQHQFNLTQPYFLSVGTIQPRKNLDQLLSGYEIFCQRQRQQNPTASLPPLVLAGKIGWLAESFLARVKASPCKSQIIFTGFIDDQLKRPLYQHALAEILVGYYEGFGIPPLEAMQAGTMVIGANNSSLPEVIGDAGWLVDPFNPQQIAQALQEVFDLSPRQRAMVAKKARQQLTKFSWAQSATQILATLEELASQIKPRPNNLKTTELKVDRQLATQPSRHLAPRSVNPTPQPPTKKLPRRARRPKRHH